MSIDLLLQPAPQLAESTYTVASITGPSAPTDGIKGPEFGKAGPAGLLVIVVLAVAVFMIGWAFHRRNSQFRRRRAFAEAHGLDPFDREAIDAAMEEAGVKDRRRSTFF